MCRNDILRLFFLMASMSLTSVAQTSGQHRELGSLEQDVAKRINDIRVNYGLKPLIFRRDLRLRMEACAVQKRGPDPKVELPRRSWFVTDNPSNVNSQLHEIALQKTEFDHVAVGIWFAKTNANPSGSYWIVVHPEHSAAHEAFWSHFYLTDAFEYQTVFDKRWKAHLPIECRTIK